MKTVASALDDTLVEKLHYYTLLAYVLSSNTHPCCLYEILYNRPSMSHAVQRKKLFDRGWRSLAGVFHQDLQNRFCEVEEFSLSALAIARDLYNYERWSFIRYWEMRIHGFEPCTHNNHLDEGSLSGLLLDCGYDARKDKQVMA